MGYQNTAKDSMLAFLTNQASPNYQITHISLHTADPGSDGANEVAGGDPEYSRIAVTGDDWETPVAGEVGLNNDKTFNGPANEDVHSFGLWANTTFLASGEITGDNIFNYLGDFILKVGTKLDLNA